MSIDAVVHDLFSSAAAKKARDEAIDQVGENADPEWVGLVRALVIGWNGGVRFTTDDIWISLPADKRPHEPRALGAVLQDLKRENKIYPTPEYQQSVRKACHARPIRIWKRT